MGAMKSMAWDYALFLQRKAQEQDDLDFNIDKKFQEIVNGEIDIPEEWLNNWVSRNSVFASEDVVGFNSALCQDSRLSAELLSTKGVSVLLN